MMPRVGVGKGRKKVIVDSHAHLVPLDLIAAIRRHHARFSSVRVIEEAGSMALAFAGGRPTRPIAKPLSDIAARLAWMDSQGIGVQVVGGWVDMFGYELPPAEGERWSRLVNEALLATAKAEPRFVPLATVPLQDGNRAAAVLKDSVAAGSPGVMIGTLPRGIGSVLDAADLDPFWKAADELGAVVHIHPSFDAGDRRVDDYGLANAVGRISDAIVAVARLLCSGHVTRHANAKIIAPMGGAALPFVLGRLKRNAAITPGVADPVEAVGRLYVDTILHDVRVLQFVIAMLGTERLMMGSDSPFPIGDLEPTKIAATAGLSADEVAAVNGGLAEKVFGIT
jgi:aminocarboxymuconate-semialdehyde decarboxylase